MKKIARVFLILVSFSLVTLLLTYSSCDKSTGPKDEDLIGTWELVSVTMDMPGVGTFTLSAEAAGMSATFVINADGTFTSTFDYGEGEGEETMEGTWELDGNEITMTDSETGIPETFEFDIDGDELDITVEMEMDWDEDGEDELTEMTLTFEKQ